MKPFVFKLELVLKDRYRKEQLALKAFAQSLSLYQESIAKRDQKSNQLKTLINQVPSGDDLNLQAMLQDHAIRGLKIRIEQDEQGIYRSFRAMEKNRLAMVHARQKTKALEVLKEKARKEYLKNLRKKEDCALDDLMIMRASQERLGVFQESEKNAC